MKSRATSLLFALAFAAPATALPAQDISSLFKRVKGSVVVVKVTDEHRPCDPDPSGEYDGLGSGVLIDSGGQILTAAHVVSGSESILVEFADGEKIPGRVTVASPGADVALIQLVRPPKQPTVAVLGDSDRAEVGDRIFVVGAPMGISYTLTVGYVSGLREDDSTVHGLETARYLQTDAAINPGNSGGPMFDERGQVVGVVSYIISASGGHEGLGFAVTSNTARKLLLQEQTALAGMEGILLDVDLAAALNVPQSMGLLVQQVAPGTPAHFLGLKAGALEAEIGGESMRVGGDIILAVDGMALDEGALPRLREHIKSLQPGRPFEVSVLRAGKVLKLKSVVRR